MKALLASLDALSPTILQLCEISGIPGVSLGVSHHGQVVQQVSYGHRDVQGQIPPDEDTIYTLGSLSKALTAAMVGILVEEKKLEWDTQLRSVFPEFTRDERDPILNLTITDLLSHRSGLPGHDSLWFLSDNRIMMKRSDAIPMFSYMPSVGPFRAGYCYNNFAYEIAGQIVEKLSGMTFANFLRERITEPLGMTRTFSGAPAGDANAAKAYMTLEDCSPVEIPLPIAHEDSLMGAAGGIRSSVSDLLRLYQAYMEAANHELESEATPISPKNPLRQIGHIWQGQINFPFRSMREYTYVCGWCRTQLPGPLALPSSETESSQLPFVGRGSPSRLTLYHEGAISGAITFSAVFPETMSSVVVLTNSAPLNYDGPRFIAQLLIETMFGVTPPDISSLLESSRKSVEATKSFVADIRREIDKSRTETKPTRPLESYIGRYYNAPETFFLEIVQHPSHDQLQLRFYGLEEEAFPLEPYQKDSFVWLTSHDELSRRGRFFDYGLEYYVIKFETELNGESPEEKMVALSWKFDSDVEGAPEKLKKKDQATAPRRQDRPGRRSRACRSMTWATYWLEISLFLEGHRSALFPNLQQT